MSRLLTHQVPEVLILDHITLKICLDRVSII